MADLSDKQVRPFASIQTSIKIKLIESRFWNRKEVFVQLDSQLQLDCLQRSRRSLWKLGLSRWLLGYP